MSAEHVVLSKSQSVTSLNADGVPRCTTHRKRLKFFCSKHELLLCSVCAVKRHRSCDDILTIVEAAEQKKEEAKRVIDTHAQRIAIVENAIVERKAAKKLLETNVQEIQNEIHEVTGKVMDLVKHGERVLMESVHNMQAREADALDSEISKLEGTCTDVRKKHESVSQCMKYSEIDLIYSVIKEKHQENDEKDVETMVKKLFREVDFKFIISPHVASFLRHFKNLGQVILSDESGTVRVPRSTMSTPVNDPPPFVPIADSRGTSEAGSTTQLYQGDDPPPSARERWQRDRQRQMQAMMRDHNNGADSVFHFDFPAPGNQNRDRRVLPMRALPRPETPEVYSRPRVETQRREFVPRPMSTPPTENQNYSPSPKSRDVDRFNAIAPYRTLKQQDANGDRRSPVPTRSQPSLVGNANQNRPDTLYHSNPAHSFQQRRMMPEVQSPPADRPRSPWSPSAQAQPVYVKEADTNFGRSFAAVQINEVPKPPRANTNSPQRSPNTYQTHSEHSPSSNDRNPGPPSYDRYSNDHFRYTDGHALEESGTFTPSMLKPQGASDEENTARWVHTISFSSHGIGSKRLLSGAGVLNDGRAVLIDQEHYTVQLYDRNFRFITEMKLESRPFDVIVLSDNKIVVSLQSERVLKFILITGDSMTTVADLGVLCDMVCYGIARGGGNYAVCCGDEVWVLSDEGRAVTCLKKDNAGQGLFLQAEYVAVDRSGTTLFVSDAGHQRILAIQVDGRRLWEFSYQGFKPTGLKILDHILYVCDRDQHRVLTLNMEGHVVKQSVIGRLENPRALCFNSAGNQLLVTQMRYDAVVAPPKPIHVYSRQ
ncbi:uncharacterized protein LOC128219571 [Mya arenaria]|nr:uncharacterized protein LOC128219571 [Mya arenaria]XP_052783356.1 uncharacterized protein LOC128219571 [Mya arenaria]